MTLGTFTDAEKKLLDTHSDVEDPIERAKDLHSDYTTALDNWNHFVEGRESKILLWKLLHETITNSPLQADLRDKGALPDVDTLRTALGIHIQDLEDASDFFDMWEKAKAYTSIMDFNKEYRGSSHFAKFGREIHQRRIVVEITSRQYTSYLRFGEVKDEKKVEQGLNAEGESSEWKYNSDHPVDTSSEFWTAAFDGSYIEKIFLWEQLLSRVHESKEGQKYLKSLWIAGGTGAPYPPALLRPMQSEWNNGASKYFEESSYPGKSNYSDFTFEKTSGMLFQTAKRLASHVQPGLTYLYATDRDLANTTRGLGNLLSQFISDSEIQQATSGSSKSLVSSPADITSGDPDDVVKFLSTVNYYGGQIADAPEGSKTYVNDWVRLTLLGAGLICGAIYQDEKENVSSNLKSELGIATDTASGVVSFLSWGSTGNNLLESLGFGTIDTFGKAGKAANIATPFLTTLDVLWSVYETSESAQTGDKSVTFGHAIGGIGSATIAASTIYAAAAEGGGFFSALATGSASGGPVTLAIGSALIIGGLALTTWTKDAELTTFFKNCRFGDNWEWTPVDVTGDGYHDPSEMWYLWNDTENDPGVSDGTEPYDHGPSNYARQVSTFLSLLHGVEASAAYDKNKYGIVELRNIQATPSSLLVVRPIEATEDSHGNNIYKYRTDISIETELHQFGEKQHMHLPYLWHDDNITPAVDLNKQEPHEPVVVNGPQATSKEFKVVIVEPEPANVGSPQSPRYELPKTITYWKGKRGFTSAGALEFERTFGLTHKEILQVNNSTWWHWVEVTLTSNTLQSSVADMYSDAGVRSDFSPADVPISIRVRTKLNVNALPSF